MYGDRTVPFDRRLINRERERERERERGGGGKKIEGRRFPIDLIGDASRGFASSLAN